MAYDMTVRDSGAHVVQFAYGADNLDPTDMEGKKGETVDFSRILNHVKVVHESLRVFVRHDSNCFSLFSEQVCLLRGAVADAWSTTSHRQRRFRSRRL